MTHRVGETGALALHGRKVYVGTFINDLHMIAHLIINHFNLHNVWKYMSSIVCNFYLSQVQKWFINKIEWVINYNMGENLWNSLYISKKIQKKPPVVHWYCGTSDLQTDLLERIKVSLLSVLYINFLTLNHLSFP